MSATLCPENDYQAFLRQGRFMIQRSASSGRHVFYPRAIAPGSGAEDLEWVEASGRGVVYSTTVVRARPPTPSHNVALVELEEGPRLMTRVEGIDPGEVRIDMPVKVRIVQEADFAYVVFDRA
ncbi:MAG: hypothetical protein JWQ90_3847 [Hydrocarboniphaga sp.]|uniref:Zn-ribbon domain-containing OB-fold protein n=1 Tax=Hydrocarboniphaga sp. TaxID=2033016 RepID=UPI00261FF375|nr:OB-fold domain-containing protein [Hydrocarboniphaga sp.]MDB5971397.1 hypothetical protein [Hydrocarboniphaga sp.]